MPGPALRALQLMSLDLIWFFQDHFHDAALSRWHAELTVQVGKCLHLPDNTRLVLCSSVHLLNRAPGVTVLTQLQAISAGRLFLQAWFPYVRHSYVDHQARHTWIACAITVILRLSVALQLSIACIFLLQKPAVLAWRSAWLLLQSDR